MRTLKPLLPLKISFKIINKINNVLIFMAKSDNSEKQPKSIKKIEPGKK